MTPDEIDVEGTILEHEAEARKQAVIYASELLGAIADGLNAGDVWRMDGNGDDGGPLFSVTFRVTEYV